MTEVFDELPATCDVVVVGGGAAGLSAAVQLARARRDVVVVDAGAPRNAPAGGVHVLLGREGVAPGELLGRGRAEVRGYGGRVVSGRVASGSVTSEVGAHAVTLVLADGRRTVARRALLALGVTDVLPAVPGLAEGWGRDVLHCPYCHGWEVRDQRLGVLATSAMAVHQALLLRQWSDDVTLLLHGGEAPAPQDAARLAARGVDVRPATVAAVERDGGRLVGVRLEDGGRVALDALAVQPRWELPEALLASLGVPVADHPTGLGRYVAADAAGVTPATAVVVAGNLADPMCQVAAATGHGALVAARLNADLVEDDTRAATDAVVTPS